MPHFRVASFTVEALEPRILLSATPWDVTPGAEGEVSVGGFVWEVGQMEAVREAGSVEEDLSGEAFLLGLDGGLELVALTATAVYSDGETVEPAIFRTGFSSVDTDATHTFSSTTGGIFFSGPGAIDGTSPASSYESVRLISATEISVLGPIGGISPLHNLVVDAGSSIVLGGSINLTGDLIIRGNGEISNVVLEGNVNIGGNLIVERGAQVSFSRNVTVQGDLVIGDSKDPQKIGGVVFGSGSVVNVRGGISIHTLGSVEFNGRIGVSLQPTSVIIGAGEEIRFGQALSAATVDLRAANVTFERGVNVSGASAVPVSASVSASNLLSIKENFDVGGGAALLTANRISFAGGAGSIQPVGNSASLTIRPFDPARPIGIGNPSGGDFNRLQVSHVELNAINTGFVELVIGDMAAGTGEVRIASLGLAQLTDIAQIQNPATFVGGSVVVEGRVDVDWSSDYLRLVARTGNVVVNAAINQSATERNGWVRLEAAAEIVVNRPIVALNRISLTAGYAGGSGGVLIQATAGNSGRLVTTNSIEGGGQIEISAGEGGGDIRMVGLAQEPVLSVAGPDGAIVLQSPEGGIDLSGGSIEATVLAMRSSGDIGMPAPLIDRIGTVVLAGETLASGNDLPIHGIEITGSGSLDFVALRPLVIDRITTGGGNVSVTNVEGSDHDLLLGRIDAAGGDIYLVSYGAMVDHVPGTETINLATSGQATLVARRGIGGAGAADIDTDLGRLAASNGGVGGIFIHNRGSLALVDELETGADGSIAVTVESGDLLVNTAVTVRGSGHILLHAVEGELTLNTLVESDEGHVTMIAGTALALLEDAVVTAAGSGAVLLRSTGGEVTMGGEAQVTVASANLRVEAIGDVVLGSLVATRVAIVSQAGSILSATGVAMNVTAAELRLEAGHAVGESARPLSLEVDHLAASAVGAASGFEGIYLRQLGSVVVSGIAPVEVAAFAADGTVALVSDAGDLHHLSAANDGTIVLVATDGAILLDGRVEAGGAGNIRIEAGADLWVREEVGSAAGHVSLVAADALIFGPDVTVSAGSAGTIWARANGGGLTMDGSSAIRASSSHLSASGSIIVGRVEGVDLSLVSDEGSITAAVGSSVNLAASHLRMEANGGVGTDLASIVVTAAVMSVHARGLNAGGKGIYLRQTDSVTVAAVGFAGQQVQDDGATAAFGQDAQAGLIAGEGGSIRLVVETGDLAVMDGDGSGVAVQVNGMGTLEIRVLAGAFTADFNAGLRSEEGDVTLVAQERIRLADLVSHSGDLFLASDEGAIVNNIPGAGANLSTSGTAHLQAATGIGESGAGALLTKVGAITAQNNSSGLIVIEQGGDAIVSGDALWTAGGIRNTAANGSVLLTTTDGSLRIDGSVIAATGGKILLQVAGSESDLNIHADVTAAGGPVSLMGQRNVTLDAAVDSGGSTVDILAVDGSLVMTAQATIQSADADIRLVAGGSLVATGVQAGQGHLHLTAGSGSILGGGNEGTRDLAGATLRLSAFDGIGSAAAPLAIAVDVVAAVAIHGSIHLSEKDDIAIDTTPVVTVDRVTRENTTQAISDTEPTSDLVAVSAGTISLVSENGSIVIEDGTLADTRGVRSAGGDIFLQAQGTILQNTGIETSGSGAIALVAGTGAIVMTDGTQSLTASGRVDYTAGGDVFLSRIISQDGDLGVTAGDRIVDHTADERPNLATSGHAALRAVHGIGGIGTADIDTDVGSISAVNAGSGRIVIDEVNGLVIAGLGLETEAGQGDIIVTVNQGDLSITSPIAAHGQGNILLHTLAANSNIESSSTVSSGSGHVSLLAPGSISLPAGAGLLSGGDGTVTLRAATGSVTMSDGVLVDGGSGDIRVGAETDVQLGGIATAGNVIVTARTGSILSSGPTLVNVAGHGVRLEAAVGIGRLGQSASPVTTNASILAARAAAGGINLLESTSVHIDDVTGVLTQKVNVDGSLTPETESGLSDLVATGGHGSVVLRTIDGGITLNDGTVTADNVAVRAHGTGNILLEARGAGANVTAHTRVVSPLGHLSILAADSVIVAPGLTILTAGGASLNIEAEAGSIVMADTTRFQSDTGSIRLVAGTDVRVGGISTAGKVAVIAVAGSILDQGDTYVDVNASAALLNAGNGVGTLGAGTSNPIETTIQTLTARGGSGGVNIREANNLTVGDVTVTVAKVGPDGLATETVEGKQAGVRTTQGDGSIVLRLAQGSFQLQPGSVPSDNFAIAAHGGGNVLVEAFGAFSDIFARGGISSDFGSISLRSVLEINFADGADIRTGGAGTIDLHSVNGFLIMSDQSLFSTESGDIRLTAPADVLIGGIRSTSGNVSIISEFASILDNGETYLDVQANGLRMVAHTDIGILVPVGVGTGPNPLNTDVSLLSARTLFGDINILETSSVTVDDVAVRINRVHPDGTTSAVDDEAQSALQTQGENGSIVLRSSGGHIVLNDGSSAAGTAITAHGNGNVLVESFGSETNVTATADVLTATGHVTIRATGSVSFEDADIITSGPGTIHVSALLGDVAQTEGSAFIAQSADIRIVAGENIYVGRITTDTRVSLIAESGSILNAGTLSGLENIAADQLRAIAGTGIGQPHAHLESRVNTVAARAAAGGIFLLETDALLVADTAASVQNVNADNTLTEVADATLSDLATTSGNGSIILRTLDGSLILDDGLAPADQTGVRAHGSGNILLQAVAAGTDIVLNADVRSTTGHITLKAARDISLSDDVTIETSAAGTIYIDAIGGSLTMGENARISATDGTLRLASAGDILVGDLTAAHVSLLSRLGSILNAPGSTKNVAALTLRLEAAQAVGTVDRYLTTSVARISAFAGGADGKGIYVTEDTAITVSAVSITVFEVNPDATATPLTDEAQAGLATGHDGHIILVTVEGSLATEQGVVADGVGSILLAARGVGSDLTIDADVRSLTGHLTLQAAADIRITGTAHVATSVGGTVSITAFSGSLAMDGGTRASALDSSLRLNAPGDITVGNLTAVDVSILSAAGSIVSALNSAKNVSATNLRLEAARRIGVADRHLTTAVSRVAALAHGSGVAGIFITEDDEVAVTTVNSITVTEFQTDTTTLDITDAAQSDLVTGGNGNIVLVTLSGSIDILDGLNADQTGVRADGEGGILLEAGGASSDLTIEADILSGTGPVTIRAARNIGISPAVNITTAEAGTVSLDAIHGTLAMAGTSVIAATGSSLRLAAAGDVRVGNLTAADVSIVARAGSIVNVAGSSKNVVSSNLRLQAAHAIGAPDRHLTTRVAHVTARADGLAASGIYVTEDTAIRIGTLDVSVLDFNSDATTTLVTDAAQSGLAADTNGNIVLVAVEGDLTAAAEVNANGTGSILLTASGAGKNVTVSADILSGTGHITLRAAASMVVDAPVRIATFSDGTVSLDAGTGSLAMVGGASVIAAASSLRLQALGDILVGNLTAGDVSILSNAGSILNAPGSTTNVAATNLRLEADQAIGLADRHLTTAIATLTARSNGTSTGGIYVSEANGATVASVGVSVTRFNADTSTTVVTDAIQSDLTTAHDGHIVLVAFEGAIVLADGANSDQIAVRAAGNGSILIDARGPGGLIVQADILSGTGQITLKAGGDLEIHSGVKVTTASAGTVSLDSRDGAVIMAGTATITATNSTLRIAATEDVVVGNLFSTDVSLVSRAGSILNASGSTRNVTATNLRLEAGQSVASATRHLTTRVANLTASAAGLGAKGIHVTEETVIIVTTLSVTGIDFNGNATATPVIDGPQAGLQSGRGGNIVLVTLSGSITTNDIAAADGVGSIRLDARGATSDLTVNADVLSGSGLITVKAARSIAFTPGVSLATAAAVSVTAATGSVTMDGSASLTAAASALRVAALTDIALGNLNGGNVSVLSAAGSIGNALGSTRNVTASDLRLEAGQAIGLAERHLTTQVSQISAWANGAGQRGIYLNEDTSITVATVSGPVVEFNADATTTSFADPAQSGLVSGNDGNIVLLATLGSITVDTGVDAAGSGSILLAARGEETLLTVAADIRSGTGHITLQAMSTLSVGSGVQIATAGPGTISVEAGLIQLDGSAAITAADGSLRLSATNDVLLGNLGARHVSVRAELGQISNQLGSSKNVTADTLRLEAGRSIGADHRPLTIAVSELSARAQGKGSAGHIYLSEDDDVTVTAVGVTVTQFNSDTSTTKVIDADQSDLVAGNNGNIGLVAMAGSITLQDGLNQDATAVHTDGHGSILIDARGLGSVLTVEADVASAGGNITLKAARDIVVSHEVNIATAAIGTISLDALGGRLTMAGTATIAAANSSLRLAANGEIQVGNLSASTVSILARAGSVVNAAGSTKNVVATNLRLQADQALGAAARHLTTDVATLTAFAGGNGDAGLYLTEDSSILVSTLGANVFDFNFDGSTTAVADAAQSGLTTGHEGPIVLVTLDGSIATQDRVVADGSGSILLEAGGTGRTLTAQDDIRSTTGLITLTAASSIILTPDVEIATGGPGDISLDARGGALAMGGGTKIVVDGGNLRLHAANDITVGTVIASGVSIVSATGSVRNATNSTHNVTSDQLRIEAGQAIGEANRHLAIAVGSLTAWARGTGARGIYLTENDAVAVTAVSVGVTLFAADGTTTEVTDAAQSDLAAGNHGDVVLVTLAGTITVASEIHANGGGHILLDARGSASGLVANADILAGTGSLSLRSTSGMAFADGVQVVTDGGTADLEAGASITFGPGAGLSTAGGNVRMLAGESILVGGLHAASGQISLTAVAGTILDHGEVPPGITASSVRLVAGSAIGAPENALDFDVAILTAQAGAGGISLRNATGLAVDTVRVAVNRVGPNGQLAAVADLAQADLVTAGSLALIAGGDVVLNDGFNDDQVAIAVGGNLLLNVAGTIDVNATLVTAGGHLSLLADGAIAFAAGVDLRTGGGTADLESGSFIFMADAARVVTSGGNVRFLALSDITVGGIDAGSGRVDLASRAGSILDGGNLHVDLVAAEARLSAAGSIGAWGQSLDTDVSVLTGLAGLGDIHLRALGPVTIGSVTVAVNRVGADFTVVALPAPAQSGLNTGGNLAMAVGGDLTLDAELTAGRNILLEVAGDLTGHQTLATTGGNSSLLVEGVISLSSGARVTTAGGTVDLEAGLRIALAGMARVETSGGNVRFLAGTDITLGAIDAGGGQVSLIAAEGSILGGGASLTNITAAELRLWAAGGMGLVGAPLELRVYILTALAGSAGLHLQLTGDTTIGPVAVAVNRVATDFGMSVISDSAQNNLVASTGPITLRGNANLLMQGLVESAGDITVDMGGGIFHDLTLSDALIATEANLVLRAGDGIGRTGAGAIRIAASTLTLENEAGSVFLTTDQDLELTGAALDGAGSLFLAQQSGTLTLSGPVTVGQGHLNLLVQDRLTLAHGAISARGNIDILTRFLTAGATSIASQDGSIDLRVASGLALDVGSPMTAGGDIRLRSGGELEVGRVQAGGLVSLVATGSITTSAPGDKGNGVVADHLRIRSGGSIGTESAPLRVDSNRFDAEAGGTIYLSHAGGLSIGRLGLKIDTVAGQEFVIDIEGGTINSVGGGLVDRGQGTLVLRSQGEITIGSLVRSENGNIRVEAFRILSGFDPATARLEAPLGRVTLVAQDGIGSTTGGAIHFGSRWIEASSVTGAINLNGLQSTTVSGPGLILGGGNGTLTLSLQQGDLVLLSSIRHLGSGGLLVDVQQGGISMNAASRISTTSGALTVKALTDAVLSRIESGRGIIRLESTTLSITRLGGFASSNVVATAAPIINVASIVDLRISADRVVVNGIEIFRRSAPVITLYLEF